MNNKQKIADSFTEFNAEDMSKLIENLETSENQKDLDLIRKKAFEKAGLKRPKIKVITLKKLLVAACVCIVAASSLCAVFLVSHSRSIPSVSETSEETKQTQASNAIMLAISNGDENLIDYLLQSKIFVNSDVLDYAIDSISFLSYTSISDIAKSVYDAFGTTGLEPLVEKALLGDSSGAIAELEKKDNAFSTYTDRLAFFFSAAFCSSDVVDLFAQKGADINSTDAAGNNIYEIAKKYGNSENENYAKTHGVS